jgi:hypothetical protein
MSNLFTLTVVEQETQEVMQHWTNLSEEDVKFARGLLITSTTAARPDWRILLVRSTGNTQTLLEGKNYERDSSPIDAKDFLIKQKQRPRGPKSGPTSARALIVLGVDLEKLKEALGSAADSWEPMVGDMFPSIGKFSKRIGLSPSYVSVALAELRNLPPAKRQQVFRGVTVMLYDDWAAAKSQAN